MAGQVIKAIVKSLTVDTWANLLLKLKKSEIGNVLDGSRAALNDNGTIREIALVKSSGTFTLNFGGDVLNDNWPMAWKLLDGIVHIWNTANIDTDSNKASQALTATPSAGFADVIPQTRAVHMHLTWEINAQPESINVEIGTGGGWVIKRSGGNWTVGGEQIEMQQQVGIYLLN